MAAAKTLTPEQRTLRARLAAHASWANTEDRSARSATGYQSSPSSVEYWERQIDPDCVLNPEQRRLRATSARDAHMARLSFNASRARARKTGGAGDGQAA
jgi:hypothetical protein